MMLYNDSETSLDTNKDNGRPASTRHVMFGIFQANNSLTMNGTAESLTPATTDPMISLTVPAVMFAAGVLGNSLALFVLARSSRETKRRPFYKLVGALAFTDLLGTCSTSPVTLAVYANNLKWVGGMELCNYESFMLIFAGCSTISIICAMALDRYFSICHPFAYDKYMSHDRTKYAIIAMWIFAIVMGCLPIVGLGENIIQFPGTWCFFTFTSSKLKNKIYTFLYAIIGLTVLLVTGISNVFVAGVLFKMRRRQKRQTPTVCRSCNTRQSKETQMLILMVGIIAIFSTCWAPFLIRLLINQVQERQVNVKADLMTLRLASLNQILDPWIYILFRDTMFKRAKRCALNILTICCSVDCLEEHQLSNVISLRRKDQYEITSDNLAYSSENQVTFGDVTPKSGENRSPQTTHATRRFSRQSLSKSLLKSKSSLMAEHASLISDHSIDCPGLKHALVYYGFASLPQNFALLLGSHGNQENGTEANAFDAPGVSTVTSFVDTVNNTVEIEK